MGRRRLPIGPVLGELIAGDYRPPFQIHPGLGKKYFGNDNAQTIEPLVYIFHKKALLPSEYPYYTGPGLLWE
jgi:hypothetical protein